MEAVTPMELLTPPLRERYDAVVIGSGFGGLTCAARLAMAGLSVLVLEKHSKIGGYVQYFGRDFTFDSDFHFCGGLGEGGWLRQALEGTGALENLTLFPLDPAYSLILGNEEYPIPGDLARFQELLKQRFPEDAPNIPHLFQDLCTLGRAFEEDNLSPLPPLVSRYQEATAEELLRDYLQNPQAQAVIAGLWLLYGLPPSQLSALAFAQGWYQFHGQGGTFYIKGGAQALAKAVADAIEARGGQVIVRQLVTRILVRNHQVLGVELEDGRQILSPIVVANISPHDLWNRLLPREKAEEETLHRLERWSIAPSALILHLALETQERVKSHTLVFHRTVDYDASYRDLMSESPSFPSFILSSPTYSDPDRARSGVQMVLIQTLAPYERSDNWQAPPETHRTPEYRALEAYRNLKESLGDRLIERVKAIYPAIEARAIVRRVATPLTLERYTFNPKGSAVGWSPIPGQSGWRLPGPQTSLKGLYQVGHWTFPGSGIAGVALSGLRSAKRILEEG